MEITKRFAENTKVKIDVHIQAFKGQLSYLSVNVLSMQHAKNVSFNDVSHLITDTDLNRLIELDGVNTDGMYMHQVANGFYHIQEFWKDFIYIQTGNSSSEGIQAGNLRELSEVSKKIRMPFFAGNFWHKEKLQKFYDWLKKYAYSLGIFGDTVYFFSERDLKKAVLSEFGISKSEWSSYFEPLLKVVFPVLQKFRLTNMDKNIRSKNDLMTIEKLADYLKVPSLDLQQLQGIKSENDLKEFLQLSIDRNKLDLYYLINKYQIGTQS